MGASFLAQNAGKTSLTLNLKPEAGKAIFRKLVEDADVLVENFRPGVMDRLGLGYEALKAINPRLVYCAISGFGQDGPMKAAPAYDQIVQGLSGVMSITGDAESAPLRVGYPVADSIGGITAAFAISSALVGRERTGVGSFLDVSMLESTIATMGWVVSNYLIVGQQPAAMGNDNFTAAPSGAFKTSDGLLNIAANKQEQFEALCGVIGQPDLAADPRFAKREARKANRAALTAEIETVLTTRSAAEWEAAFNAVGVPAGRVLTVPQALDLPQIRERGLVQTFDHVPALDRPLSVSRAGFKVDGDRSARHHPAAHAGRTHRPGPGRALASRPTRSPPTASRGSSDGEITGRDPGRRPRLVVHRHHRYPPGRDQGPRLSDPGPDRPSLLPADDLADGARRPAEPAAGAAAGGRPGRLGRPRPAGAVDLDRPHGRQLRRRAQQRHGLGHQRAGRRPRRRRPAVHGADAWIKAEQDAGASLDQAVETGLARYTEEHGKIVGGFGHRWHPVDPRSKPLMALVEVAAEAGAVKGDYVAIGWAVEAALTARKGKPIPMNIDGATAVIFSELGFPPPMGRGLFILSRSVGILAHAWEQTQQGQRIKGPMPKDIPFTYTGPADRKPPQ
jgi:CoA:oxalate CoA-transferase